jgi:hypothetical protein
MTDRSHGDRAINDSVMFPLLGRDSKKVSIVSDEYALLPLSKFKLLIIFSCTQANFLRCCYIDPLRPQSIRNIGIDILIQMEPE